MALEAQSINFNCSYNLIVSMNFIEEQNLKYEDLAVEAKLLGCILSWQHIK